MEDNLYFIGINNKLSKIADRVGMVDDAVSYYSFWENFCIIQYDTISHKFLVKENLVGEPQYSNMDKENELFKYMNEKKFEFILDNNPMGKVFRSYTAAFLEIVRWAADVAYTKKFYESLVDG